MSELTLPAVLGAGLVDSLNPCAFALLLVFVATTLSLVQRGTLGTGQARRWLLGRGGVYITGIFLTYLALGFGLLGALGLAQELSGTHLVSRVAALLALGLGLLTVQEALLPEFGTRLSAHIARPALQRWASRLSVPGLFGAGILVGLCTVPCAGAVYLAVLALLSAQTTALVGAGYLVAYNLAFVAPLVAVLWLASNRSVYRHLAHLQQRWRGAFKFATGAAAIAIGLLTLAVV